MRNNHFLARELFTISGLSFQKNENVFRNLLNVKNKRLSCNNNSQLVTNNKQTFLGNVGQFHMRSCQAREATNIYGHIEAGMKAGRIES